MGRRKKAAETGRFPPELLRQLDELIAETSKSDEARAIAAFFLAAYERHKADLPPPLPTDQR